MSLSSNETGLRRRFPSARDSRVWDLINHRISQDTYNYEPLPNDLEEINLQDFGDPNIVSDNVPLIAAAAPAAAAGVSAPTIAGGALAAGITGAAVTGAIVASQQDDQHTDPIVSIPGHHYLGPGNSIDEVGPIDIDDDIARDHDIAYSRAQNEQDIHDADDFATNEFLTDAFINGNPHSILGAAGLGFKSAVEKQVGVIYGLSPGKEWLLLESVKDEIGAIMLNHGNMKLGLIQMLALEPIPYGVGKRPFRT